MNISDLNIDEEAKAFWHQAHIKPEAAVRAAMERGAELGIEMALKEIKSLRRDLEAARNKKFEWNMSVHSGFFSTSL